MEFIYPMLLEQADKPFSDGRYVFEPKIDGHRLILSRRNGQTRLYTRHNNDVTSKYPELITDGPDIILDGELVVMDPDTGIPDFELTMQRFHSKRSRLPISYVVFDILHYDGVDLRGLTLMERKAVLDGAITNTPTMSKIAYIDGRGEDLWGAIVARNMEGIVAKKKDGRYHSDKRTDDFIKIINYTYVDVQIAGYRKGDFGWLAHYNGRPAGVIEFGVPPTHKKAFYGVAKSLVTGEDRDFVYIQPQIKARVKMRNWTKSGMLRSPVFVDFILAA
ncbi:ATP-dependent DNA ligase [Brevibacillus sp. M2.1A]|uniref:ATP-dependent DNA ligase n=1 Tax=Brevibacillus sp. M2.1A TaxID=2738980 RepID=UPI00156B753A|nr:RNA ligase family protein [Brevibacillus sp. M2.1A]MCC8435502.1 ATP-dependent DNA ligase [Brevibacillus sp. M2.1A]